MTAAAARINEIAERAWSPVVPMQLAPTPPLTPERRLLLAALEQGIDDLDHSDPRIRSLAEQWLASASTAGPFTFVSICDALDLSPDATRDAIEHRT